MFGKGRESVSRGGSLTLHCCLASLLLPEKTSAVWRADFHVLHDPYFRAVTTTVLAARSERPLAGFRNRRCHEF